MYMKPFSSTIAIAEYQLSLGHKGRLLREREPNEASHGGMWEAQTNAPRGSHWSLVQCRSRIWSFFASGNKYLCPYPAVVRLSFISATSQLLLYLSLWLSTRRSLNISGRSVNHGCRKTTWACRKNESSFQDFIETRHLGESCLNAYCVGQDRVNSMNATIIHDQLSVISTYA